MSKEKKEKKVQSEEGNIFPKKYMKIIDQLTDFKLEADAASIDDLKKIIVNCEGNLFNNELDILKDDKLQGAIALVKDFKIPYKEVKTAQNAKIQYALFLLSEKGAEIGG